MVAYVLQRRGPPLTSWLIGMILVASIAGTLDDGTIYAHLALLPRGVWRGELWRLVTWVLVEPGPLQLILTCVAIYTFGGALRWTWGPRRFARFLAAIVLSCGVGTSLIAHVLPMAWWLPHLGGFAVAAALTIAWALQFPDRQVIVYWVLLTNGRPLAYGTLAVTVLFAFYYGIAVMLPELIACLGALFYMTKTRRRWWLLFKAYLAQRKLDAYQREHHPPS